MKNINVIISMIYSKYLRSLTSDDLKGRTTIFEPAEYAYSSSFK